VHRALKLSPDERAHVRRGWRPLVLSRPRQQAPTSHWAEVGGDLDEAIAEAVRLLTDERPAAAADAN
jgi:hypothetical protein